MYALAWALTFFLYTSSNQLRNSSLNINNISLNFHLNKKMTVFLACRAAHSLVCPFTACTGAGPAVANVCPDEITRCKQEGGCVWGGGTREGYLL